MSAACYHHYVLATLLNRWEYDFGQRSVLKLHVCTDCDQSHSSTGLLLLPTLTGVTIPLVTWEAGTLVAPDIVCAVCKNITRSKNRIKLLQFHHNKS